MVAHLPVDVLHLLLVCDRHCLPGIEQRPKSFRDFFLCFGYARFERPTHGGLEPSQETFLFRGRLLREFHARRIELQPPSIRGTPHFFVESIELAAARALNLIGKGSGALIARFRKMPPPPFASRPPPFFPFLL